MSSNFRKGNKVSSKAINSLGNEIMNETKVTALTLKGLSLKDSKGVQAEKGYVSKNYRVGENVGMKAFFENMGLIEKPELKTVGDEQYSHMKLMNQDSSKETFADVLKFKTTLPIEDHFPALPEKSGNPLQIKHVIRKSNISEINAEKKKVLKIPNKKNAAADQKGAELNQKSNNPSGNRWFDFESNEGTFQGKTGRKKKNTADDQKDAELHQKRDNSSENMWSDVESNEGTFQGKMGKKKFQKNVANEQEGAELPDEIYYPNKIAQNRGRGFCAKVGRKKLSKVEREVEAMFEVARTFKPPPSYSLNDFDGCGVNIFAKEDNRPVVPKPYIPYKHLTGFVAKMDSYTSEEAQASREHAYRIADEIGEDWSSELLF